MHGATTARSVVGNRQFPVCVQRRRRRIHARRRAAAFVRLRGIAARVRGGRREGSRVRDGVLGNRDDVVSPDLGAAERAGAGGGHGRRAKGGAARAARHRLLDARARLHRRDRRVLSRRRSARPRVPARGPTAMRWAASQASFPTITKRRSSTRCRCSARAPPDDATFANQKKAAAILNALLPLEPQHPGIAHYMIHSFDYPQLAADALPAARAYSQIAPDSPHALHMPSHIFTRLGLWQDSIASNLASADAGRALVAAATSRRDVDGHAARARLPRVRVSADRRRGRGAASPRRGGRRDDVRRCDVSGGLRACRDPRALCVGAARLEGRRATRAADRRAAVGDAFRTRTRRRTSRRRSALRDRVNSIAPERRCGSSRRSTPELQKAPIPGPYDWTEQVESARLGRGSVARVTPRDARTTR